jgi:hypothetical protein
VTEKSVEIPEIDSDDRNPTQLINDSHAEESDFGFIHNFYPDYDCEHNDQVSNESQRSEDEGEQSDEKQEQAIDDTASLLGNPIPEEATVRASNKIKNKKRQENYREQKMPKNLHVNECTIEKTKTQINQKKTTCRLSGQREEASQVQREKKNDDTLEAYM